MTIATIAHALGLRPAVRREAEQNADLHAALIRWAERHEFAEARLREATLREQVDAAIAEIEALHRELAVLRRAAGAEPVERPALPWLRRETA